MYDTRLKQNLPRVEDRIDAALERAGRRPAGVRLIAVTKGHGAAAVEAAWRAGITVVGENRVQELEEKRALLAASDVALEWHMVGHLQRNKVRRALPLFDCIHSVDSPRLARELSKEAVRAGIEVRALMQVNVSGEATKGGFDGPRALAGIAEAAALPALAVLGIMTMAPLTQDESVVRRTFTDTRELLERCMAERVPLHGHELSMGMSTDYELAIEEGSTMIRLGTTLFGERVS